ncbi:DUF4832 domain-containing protein [Paenibacillus rhizovicinus]|uniref:DUF4832 domain-containing protein n=1 Tax=Paenibacillus rhizovicinus TaxID=2704463 RepID=A0A6C0NZS7_9BACL|nr:DUF4832 domain-containing protein [Paenibacillus rhizovicinus]QHW31446.1 DUF4832 domain-containing protein [Paenibacillus rhizovicinus]
MVRKRFVVRPGVIDDVLVNPGIGFTTFQRFNGDQLNAGNKWTEGFPIDYQPFEGSLANKDHPMTSIAYYRIYWRFLEPEQGQYDWELIDRALRTAQERKQTLMLRVAPYGECELSDVPDWYRRLPDVSGNPIQPRWRVDPEDPRYVSCFGGFIRALGERYDLHPGLESVDMAIIGSWGEGEGSELLTQPTREALMDCYIDSFRETPLLMLLTDDRTNRYGLSRAAVGWRADCLGDMGGYWSNLKDIVGWRADSANEYWDIPLDWSHMTDCYPQLITLTGVQDAWKKAPVSFEVCWVVQDWYDRGWDIDYIIDQSLKWHISTFNAKSSPIPQEWEPNVRRWLNKMGYRYALRKITYPESVEPGGELDITTWWENLGVAPCYRRYPLALRLRNDSGSTVLRTDADIREWLPGDTLYDGAVALPADLLPGRYQLELAILGTDAVVPAVQLAVEGRQSDGWYTLGGIEVAAKI